MIKYHQFAAFDCPNLSCNDHCGRWFFQDIFFYCYFYFLEILLNDLKLTFLEFKLVFGGESKRLQHSAALEHAESISHKKAFRSPSKGPWIRHMGMNRKGANIVD